MEGLSLRTIFVDFVSQLIVLLYLFDNDTSWTILISSTVGVAIEGWKIPKAFIVERKPTFPFLSIKDRQSYSATRTKEFDEIAYRYLTMASIPLMIGYAIYSLLYNSHKGWYSYIISTLVGFVYTFGFIKMTPQLFINYKLKTVAHMPWRAFTYKALNTVVDDLFAFVIRMPLMHRIACFRDGARSRGGGAAVLSSAWLTFGPRSQMSSSSSISTSGTSTQSIRSASMSLGRSARRRSPPPPRQRARPTRQRARPTRRHRRSRPTKRAHSSKRMNKSALTLSFPHFSL